MPASSYAASAASTQAARTFSAKIDGVSNRCDIDYQVPTVNARDVPTNVASTRIMIVQEAFSAIRFERSDVSSRPPTCRWFLGSDAVSNVVEPSSIHGLQSFLDRLGFNVVGFGCTTCIGHSGPLDRELEDTLARNDLIAASVLSENRNFEARIHQSGKANFLMSADGVSLAGIPSAPRHCCVPRRASCRRASPCPVGPR